MDLEKDLLSDMFNNMSFSNNSMMHGDGTHFGDGVFATGMNNGGMGMGPGNGLGMPPGGRPMLQGDMRQQLIARQIAEQRANVARVAVKYHLALGPLILIANGFLIGFYIRYPPIRRYVSITMLSVFIAGVLQVIIFISEIS